MKIKCGYLALGTGLAAMASGALLKDMCPKCGSALFGLGLGSAVGGTLSLMKQEKFFPQTLPMGKVNIEM